MKLKIDRSRDIFRDQNVMKEKEKRKNHSRLRRAKKALSMKRPGDLLNICKALYTELQLLGFDALRNSMINIHDDDNESFLNYDYARGGGGHRLSY